MFLGGLRSFNGQGMNAICQMDFALAVLSKARGAFSQQGAATLCQMRCQQTGCAAFRRGFVGVDHKQNLTLFNPVTFFDPLFKQHP